MSTNKIPATFKKLVVTRTSQNFREVVRIETASTTKPGEKEILVKNRFVGINASDINYSAGRYGFDQNTKFPIDAGFEAIGEVVEAGAKSGFKAGQPVLYCMYGAFCEYKVLDGERAIPLPELKAEYMPFVLSGNTAAISLDKVGEIKKGETVLITAAAGGTGQIAVQWAKLAGCHVIGTCSSEEKVNFLKELGCDRPVNYTKEELSDVLKKEYPKGVDVVYETIGGEMFDTCVANLALKGRLMVIGYIKGYETDQGFPSSKALASLPRMMLSKSASVRGFLLHHYAADWVTYFMKQVDYYKAGKLRSVVDQGQNSDKGPFVGLEMIPDAVEYLFSKKSIGKIIVELNV